MKAQEYKLTFEGPFQWTDPNGPDYLFDGKSIYSSGVYIWTLPYKKSELAHYVGKGAFFNRHRDHLFWYASGRYPIYDPSKVINGEWELLWEGARWDVCTAPLKLDHQIGFLKA